MLHLAWKRSRVVELLHTAPSQVDLSVRVRESWMWSSALPPTDKGGGNGEATSDLEFQVFNTYVPFIHCTSTCSPRPAHHVSNPGAIATHNSLIPPMSLRTMRNSLSRVVSRGPAALTPKRWTCSSAKHIP